MTNRALIIAVLVILVALGTNLIVDDKEAADDDVELQRNDPDLYMLDAKITKFDQDGQVQHKILADRFTHFPLTDLTVLEDPVIKLFADENKQPWDIESRNGRLLPESAYREQVVELWEQVVATQHRENGRFINIQTNSLTVYPDRDYAETDQKVFIDDDTGRTTAAGMQAFFESGRFIFYSGPGERVKTIFLPVFKD